MSALALLSPVLDLVYPPRCFVCRDLGPTGGLCDACLAAVTPVSTPACDICGHPLGHHRECYDCLRRPPAFVRGRAWGGYEGVLQDAIHRFKYHDRPALAEPLGIQLAAFARTQSVVLNDLIFDALIPVPMHPKRRRLRGYNQSERLARVVARDLQLPMHSDWLRRIRPTRPQVGLDADARATNLHAAFSANAGVTGKTLLLIDDVTTTGSTLHESAIALTASGAQAVYALTLAAG